MFRESQAFSMSSLEAQLQRRIKLCKIWLKHIIGDKKSALSLNTSEKFANIAMHCLPSDS